jgi:HEAT repeat protein
VYVRRNAAEALGQIKSDRAIDSLIALIKDTDADVRKNARKSLLFLSNYDINRKLFDIISSPKPVFKNEAEKVLLVKYGIISEDSFKYY